MAKGKRYALLSALKGNKVEYLDRNTFAVIPCPTCQKEGRLYYDSSFWECVSCNTQGDFFSLLEQHKQVPMRSNIFNPNKERRKLISLFNQYTKKYEENPVLSNDIQKLKEITNNLIKNLIKEND